MLGSPGEHDRTLALTKAQDIQHKLWELMMKGHLYWAPVDKPKSVLDIVCLTSAGAPCYFPKPEPSTLPLLSI